jgi:hypothetical protein
MHTEGWVTETNFWAAKHICLLREYHTSMPDLRQTTHPPHLSQILCLFCSCMIPRYFWSHHSRFWQDPSQISDLISADSGKICLRVRSVSDFWSHLSRFWQDLSQISDRISADSGKICLRFLITSQQILVKSISNLGISLKRKQSLSS